MSEFDYINTYYKVKAKKGGRVIMDGKPGKIIGVQNAHLMIKFDDKKHALPCHPTWRMEYLSHKQEQVELKTEIVYTWSDGRQEVRYSRDKDSPEALKLIDEVLELQKQHGVNCPYSYRHIGFDLAAPDTTDKTGRLK